MAGPGNDLVQVFRPNSGYTGSFCVFGPALRSPAHGLPYLAMDYIENEIF
jgi:hypothetical protein